MTRVRSAAATALLLLACFVAPSFAGPPAADVARQILTLRSMHDAAVHAGNVDGILAFYTADVQLMPPGEATVRGKDAMRAWLATGRLPSPGNVAVSVQAFGDTVVYVADPKAPRADADEDRVRAVCFLAKQADGSWKYKAVIWNTVAPPK